MASVRVFSSAVVVIAGQQYCRVELARCLPLELVIPRAHANFPGNPATLDDDDVGPAADA